MKKKKALFVTLMSASLLSLLFWCFLHIVLSTSQDIKVSNSIDVSYHVRDNAFAATDGSFYKEIIVKNALKTIEISMESPNDSIRIYVIKNEWNEEIIAIEDNYICAYFYFAKTLEEVDISYHHYSCDASVITIINELNLGTIKKRLLVSRKSTATW